MGVQTESFYNKFSFFYPLVDIFLWPQKNVLINEVNRLPNGKLLEIGVGNGAHLPLYNAHDITAIDTSAAMLANARIHNSGNAKLLQMDGMALGFDDECFDYVVLSHVIAVVDDPEQLLHEVFRVLKTNGQLLILNHFTPDNWLRHADEAFSVISKYFHFKSVFRIDEVKGIEKFSLINELPLGSGSYFKLLIYRKK